MKYSLLILTSMLIFQNSKAQVAERIDALEKRVEVLERRLAQQEASAQSTTQNSPTPEQEKNMKLFDVRTEADKKNYKLSDIMRAEHLYSMGAGQLHSGLGQQPGQAGEPLLETVVKTYPELNRAGCSQLYLSRFYKSGAEKEALLKDCIARFSNCFYGDGTQVGPYAKYCLAYHYLEQGKDAKAKELFKQIREQHPYATNHSGQLLVSEIK